MMQIRIVPIKALDSLWKEAPPENTVWDWEEEDPEDSMEFPGEPPEEIMEVPEDPPEPPLEKTIVLIASSMEIDTQKIPCRHFVEYFDDLDREVPGRSMTAQQADNYVRFLTRQGTDAELIYCCCQSAQSRSPAMAAALHRFYGNEEQSAFIWKNPHYAPNPLVYQLFCQALGIPVEDQELDILIETNRKVFRDMVSFHW